jgi:hypothetical protein
LYDVDSQMGMKLAFVDTEFTGEHAKATLVSLGIVGMGDEHLSLTFNDYDRDQVTPWLQSNVLDLIDAKKSVSQREGFQIVSAWFDKYSSGERVALVSAGKLLDLMLLWELWHFGKPDWKYFHHLHGLPEYFNHAGHLDLPTVFYLAGLDPNLDREAFTGHSVQGRRHEALYDAKLVRECFKKVVNQGNFPHLALPR